MGRNSWQGLSENIWVNLLWFQLLWWLSILQTDSARWPVLLLLVAHLVMHRHLFTEALVITACGCLGFIVDSLLTLLGFFRFYPDTVLPPFWLFLLWLGFAATLRQGLKFFVGRWYLAMLSGAVAGAATYFAAAELGAVALGWSDVESVLLLAGIWALMFPGLLWLSHSLGRRYV
ncbi:DUF2878 domain-containing protein [Aliamphritea hakodatensis]|uniref:DUF2878 domain-containing protein n=1 Tax=Aliamphritea hakodatensis TaxID=2895352 RepID=UPI0022FD49B4|nr:DUF2878 domain-containing protein [Aliamphritea hakodatensis]